MSGSFYLKTSIFRQNLVTVSMFARNILNITGFKKYVEYGCVDSNQVEVIKNNIANGFLVNPNIFINLVLNEEANESADIPTIISSIFQSGSLVNSCIEWAELLSGFNELAALSESDNVNFNLFATFSFSLSKEAKEALFLSLNRGEENSIVLSRKSMLNLLDGEYGKLFKTLKILNESETSPIKDRIAFDDKVVGGLNPNTLMELIKDSDILKYIPSEEKAAKLIMNILNSFVKSFELVYAANRDSVLRHCDIRYALAIFPYIREAGVLAKTYLTEENISDMLLVIKEKDAEICDKYGKAIRAEGLIRALAKKHGKLLVKFYESKESFSPFDIF